MPQAGRTRAGGAASALPRLLIIAGPTASGKSALALALARRVNGTIINADAMQCYAELRILTARPSAAEEALLPHRLYGVRAAATPANAAWWRRVALATLEEARAAGRMPILCGGTGLYLRALLQGIAEIPDPGATARAEARALLAELGPAALHARLAAVDPATAARLRPSDSQRLARAFEVWRGTGRGLADWQAQPTAALAGWAPRVILLDPARATLRAAIAARFAAMLREGALDELASLLAAQPDPALPLLRAHGVPELTRHLEGRLSLKDAAEAAIAATSAYTRRQTTWFRHQPLADSAAMHTIYSRIADDEQLLESLLVDLCNFIYMSG